MMTDTPRETPAESDRLERPQSGRILAGVARGLSDRYDIGVGWIRLGFILLTFAGGLGLVLYGAGWLAMPDEGETESILDRALEGIEDPGRWLGIGLIAVGAVIVVGWTGLVESQLLFAAGLVLVGLLLYRGDAIGRSPRSSPPEPAGDDDSGRSSPREEPVDIEPPGTIAAEGSGAPTGSLTAAIGETLPEPRKTRPPRQKRQKVPKKRSPLALLTAGVVLVVIGVMSAVAPSGTGFDARDLAGAVFLILGAGLLVGTWYGRARVLTGIGLLLMPFAFLALVLDVPLRGDVGDIRYVVDGAVSAADYEQLAGQMVVDLRQVEPGTGGTVHATLGFGEVVLVLPEDVNPIIDAEIGAGVITIGDVERGGFDVKRTFDLGGDGQLRLDVDLGIGRIIVRER